MASFIFLNHSKSQYNYRASLSAEYWQNPNFSAIQYVSLYTQHFQLFMIVYLFANNRFWQLKLRYIFNPGLGKWVRGMKEDWSKVIRGIWMHCWTEFRMKVLNIQNKFTKINCRQTSQVLPNYSNCKEGLFRTYYFKELQISQNISYQSLHPKVSSRSNIPFAIHISLS